MVNKFYRINQNIRAAQVRVIGDDGRQVGILTGSDALKLAQEKGLDLVEIAPNANPPVVKIIDFNKFLYQEEKREREVKKKIRGGEIKGIRLSPFIADGDLQVRIRKTAEFLKGGNKVRVAVRFKGRQMGKGVFGYALLGKFIEALKSCSQPEGEPRWFGRELVLTLAPGKHESAQEKNKETL